MYFMDVTSYSKKHKIKVPRFNEAAGFYTTTKRSKIMSRIRGKNTKPEMLLRRALWARGVRYRVDNKKLPGKPDISIQKYRLAIFIDGEFWHGYDWHEKKHQLKSNRGFWIPKIERNMQKDFEVNETLEEMGYTVFRFWAKELSHNLHICTQDIIGYIQSYPYLKNAY